MILQIFTVYDQKAESYLPPFYDKTKGSAIRSFSETVNTPDHQFNKYPEDFTLFLLGSYDDQHAEITTLPAKESLGLALEFIISE